MKTPPSIRKIKDLPDDEYQACKKLYMGYHAMTAIAKEFNVARTSLTYHATKYWKLERDMAKADLFTQFTDSKKSNFVKMSQAAIQVMTRALENQARREVPPTLREANDAVKILEALDKITRLDDGSPTDITAEKAVSFKDIDAVASLNPFKNKEIENAEYKELDESSIDDSDDNRDNAPNQ